MSKETTRTKPEPVVNGRKIVTATGHVLVDMKTLAEQNEEQSMSSINNPIGSMYGIFTYSYLHLSGGFFMINGGKYTIVPWILWRYCYSYHCMPTFGS